MSGKILDSTIGALNTSLNLRQMNETLISGNIANADTPGYKSKTIDFESKLKEVLGVPAIEGGELSPVATHPGHAGFKDTDPVDPEIIDDPNGVEALDGNTVDRSAEMAKMVENQLLYNANVEMLRKKLGMLRYGITEGGGSH